MLKQPYQAIRATFPKAIRFDAAKRRHHTMRNSSLVNRAWCLCLVLFVLAGCGGTPFPNDAKVEIDQRNRENLFCLSGNTNCGLTTIKATQGMAVPNPYQEAFTDAWCFAYTYDQTLGDGTTKESDPHYGVVAKSRHPNNPASPYFVVLDAPNPDGHGCDNMPWPIF